MWHLRGWLLMCLLSAALFIIVDIPAAYQRDVRSRHIFIAVMLPVTWGIYSVVLYICLYRPMRRMTEMYRNDVACDENTSGGSVFLWSKEQHLLNATIEHLRRDTEKTEKMAVYWQPRKIGNGQLGCTLLSHGAVSTSISSPEPVAPYDSL
ncbi:hypothetical protein DQ04_00491140 [Trypanosoma grayi]|uniref:hypothetical protein n=1 Tax=Trypanosoma grayi TaxID=71804 RepID=UPI0004F46EAD|nr:hypothetical protein DQ04_00491140 [Trypanosoma grayi]KEG14394.1 hypothetical protein DQ04_00491140 [Trypanosoma grayi]